MSIIGGVVDSPTPMISTEVLSISVILQFGKNRCANNAEIHPADPPPTTTISLLIISLTPV